LSAFQNQDVILSFSDAINLTKFDVGRVWGWRAIGTTLGSGRVVSDQSFKQIWRVGSGQNILNALCEFCSFYRVSNRNCNEKVLH